VYGLPSSLFFLLVLKLKIDTRRFLIGVNNKERFADVPKVEVNINLLDAMKAADARLTIDAETIE
jgi:hypothetical protein